MGLRSYFHVLRLRPCIYFLFFRFSSLTEIPPKWPRVLGPDLLPARAERRLSYCHLAFPARNMNELHNLKCTNSHISSSCQRCTKLLGIVSLMCSKRGSGFCGAVTTIDCRNNHLLETWFIDLSRVWKRACENIQNVIDQADHLPIEVGRQKLERAGCAAHL